MTLIVVANTKGGCGKTTIATNLAIMRAYEKSKVLILNTDPQSSSTVFCKVREELKHEPFITCKSIFDKGIVHQLIHLLPKYDDIVIDIAGTDSDTFRALLMFNDVDKLVVPILPSQVDIWSLQDLYSSILNGLAVNSKLKVIPFFNRKDTNPKITLADQARELIAAEMPSIVMSDITIGDRIVYRRAFAEGMCIDEVHPCDVKALVEIHKLYEEVFNEV